MKKLSFLVLFLSFHFLAIHQLTASHIIGGDITYQCLGNNQYKVNMTIYGDCTTSTTPFDNSATISIYTGDGNLYTTLFVPIGQVTTLPLTLSNSCLVPSSTLCLKQGTYEVTTTLPYDFKGYFITYERCCRSNMLTNIANAGQTGMTITTFISDQAQLNCKSSPVFNNNPPVLYCVNENMTIDASAIDPDGDSLVYSLCPLFAGGSLANPVPNPASPPPYDSVSYLSTYSETQPISGTFSLNTQTGIITGLPIAAGSYAIGVCVDKYSNGVWIGSTKRDFTIGVVSCTHGIVADSIDQAGNFIINSCDTTINLAVPSSLTSLIDSFDWEVTLSSGNIITSTMPNLAVTFPALGSYSGRVIVTSDSLVCIDTISFIVNIITDTSLQVGFTYSYDSTVIDPIAFQGTANSNDSIVAWFWDFGDGNTSNVQNPIYQHGDSGVYLVTLVAVTTEGCYQPVVQPVPWYPIPILLSTNAEVFAKELTLSPNPTTRNTRITGLTESEVIEHIQILNSNGQVIKTIEYPNQVILRTADLSNGLYFITIHSNKRHRTLKLMVLNSK